MRWCLVESPTFGLALESDGGRSAVVSRSYEAGKNRGRHYVVGHDQKGWCHAAWVDQVIRVESVQQALAAGKVMQAIEARSSC